MHNPENRNEFACLCGQHRRSNPVQLNASTYPFEPVRPQELRMLSEDLLVSLPNRLNPKLEALKLQTQSASFVALAAAKPLKEAWLRELCPASLQLKPRV